MTEMLTGKTCEAAQKAMTQRRRSSCLIHLNIQKAVVIRNLRTLALIRQSSPRRTRAIFLKPSGRLLLHHDLAIPIGAARLAAGFAGARRAGCHNTLLRHRIWHGDFESVAGRLGDCCRRIEFYRRNAGLACGYAALVARPIFQRCGQLAQIVEAEDLGGPSAGQRALEARPCAQIVVLGVLIGWPGFCGLGGTVPVEYETPFELAQRRSRHDFGAGAGSGPESRVGGGHLVEHGFVDAALVGGLPLAGEDVLDEVPGDEDDDHHGDDGDEVPFYAGVGLERVHVHAEEGADEGQR